MIDAIIRGTLGDFGSAVLDFYNENTLWINGILLFYALILVFAKRGYKTIIEAINTEIVREHGKEVFTRNEKNFKKAYVQINLDWESIANQTKMPIISSKGSLIFRIKSANFLRQHFTPEKVYDIFKGEKAKPGE